MSAFTIGTAAFAVNGLLPANLRASKEDARRRCGRAAPALAVLGALVLISIGARPARAQFVCADSANNTQGATATGDTRNFACGPLANAAGISNAGNTATGTSADASGSNDSFNTATGNLANASGNGNGLGNSNGNVATGDEADAHGNVSNNVATGAAALAFGNGSGNVATGNLAFANGDGSFNTATGTLAKANGDTSANIATGFQADASGNGSNNIAIGTQATANGDATNNIAIGTGAHANFSDSAAFGNGAATTRANQQVFGTATNTYTLPGITSAASKAAQSGPVQLVTSDASGNLATADLGLGDINAKLDSLDRRSSQAFSGIAMAFAMAGVPTLLPAEKFAVTANLGTYEGAQGLAFNAAMRLTNNMQFTGGVGYGPNDHTVGARVGLRIGW